jgi:H+/Cl- antiporter ClcA
VNRRRYQKTRLNWKIWIRVLHVMVVVLGAVVLGVAVAVDDDDDDV